MTQLYPLRTFATRTKSVWSMRLLFLLTLFCTNSFGQTILADGGITLGQPAANLDQARNGAASSTVTPYNG